MESLSSYARQFLGQMNKPDVDAIEGLSPAVSIDQKATSLNIEYEKKIEREEFLNNLAKEFLSGYDKFIKNGLETRYDRRERAGPDGLRT